MSIVRTLCEHCGDIRVGPESIVLETYASRHDAYCVITCPTCGRSFDKPANDALYAMLTAIGVRVRYLDELPHDNPLTFSDIEQFSRMLATDDYVVRLLEDV